MFYYNQEALGPRPTSTDQERFRSNLNGLKAGLKDAGMFSSNKKFRNVMITGRISMAGALFFLYFTPLLVSGCSKPAGRENQAIIYKEGTYHASTEGYGGNLTLEVDFSGNSILAARITEHNETRWIGDQAVDFLPDEIIGAQSWDVDVVAGATITSEAIKAAAQNCIKQAMAGNEGEE
jgi:fumarate reductase flavoprotein subunit